MPNDAHRVEITIHDPQWAALFRQEATILCETLQDQVVAVHHVGSTAIPGLTAKPIIDILLEVRDIEKIDRHNDQFRSLGYEPRGEYGLPRRRYFPKIIAGEHTHHVHTWQTGDPEIERHISFRDYLIAHPEAADTYARLKEDLVQQYNGTKEGYINGKDAFCQKTEQQSLAWRRTIRAKALQSDRLTLLPLNHAELWHYLNRPNQLEAALGVQLSRAILADPVPNAMRTKLRNTLDVSLAELLWQTYWLIIIRDLAFGAGLIGFKGTPQQDQQVEIGYGIDATMRRQGYATEAVGTLVNWALTQTGCSAVAAYTELDNTASIRVLEKSGFALARDTDDLLCWIVTGPTR